jgi:hypothetical protein
MKIVHSAAIKTYFTILSYPAFDHLGKLLERCFLGGEGEPATLVHIENVWY